jgi:hypothetical protein
MNKKILLITSLLGVFVIAGCSTPIVDENATNIIGNQVNQQDQDTDSNQNTNPSTNPPQNTNPIPSEEVTIEAFVQCLKENGMVIYGSKTCPACGALAESFGGYEVIAPIYVECTENGTRCSSEMQSGYVPEIQINGEVYSGPRDLNSLANLANCKL